MKKILLSFLFLLFFFQFSITKTYALVGAFNHVTDVVFCNDDPTNWQVYAYYHDVSPAPGNNILLGSSMSLNDGSGLTACPGDYESFEWVDQKPESGDYVHWYTACVDPNVSISVSPIYKRIDGGIYIYVEYIPVQCKAMGAGGTPNYVYAGCYNLSYNSVNYGTIASSAQCPYYDTNDSYCTKGGVTAYPTLCGNSYCGGTGNCTYYDKICSGTSCSHTAYANDLRCASVCTTTTTTSAGGSWSGLSVSPSCNTTYPTVSQAQFSWAYSGTKSSYDLHWATSVRNTTGTSYNVPYSYTTCTSGPGGCSFSYGINVSWYVTAKNSSGTVVSTSPTQSFTTANCSGTGITCQQCVSGTCQNYNYTGGPTCPTNCSACTSC